MSIRQVQGERSPQAAEGDALPAAAKGERLGWAGPLLAAVAFVAVFAAFAWQLVVYQRNVRAWAEQELQSRADLAAIVLAEPLRTLDFKAIRTFGATCKAEGLRLRICHGDRFYLSEDAEAGFYDTAGGAVELCLFKTARSGSYVIGIGRPSFQMLMPFLKALVVIVLAGLLGVAGVILFFVVTWRQRLRIRALARLEKFRREFVADLSHEIKTPLTGILGAADLMDGRDPLAAMVKKEATRLNALVQQILDLARLEREGEALRREEVDLAELVRETVARFRPKARAAGIDLTVAAASAPSLRGVCDPLLIAEALDNLVENALRHSGSPTVRVSCGAAGHGGVRLVVEDAGRGVPPDEAERIFERFHRVDPARAADTGGAGLGLAIVRRIARLHGGDVTCEPAAPHGARFAIFWYNPRHEKLQ